MFTGPVSRTSIAVITDDRLLSDACVQFLGEEADFAVRAVAGPSTGSLGLLDPDDVALVDARLISRVSPLGLLCDRPAVIVMGGEDDDAWATGVLVTGVRGILLRTASRGELLQAIRVVRDGGLWARRRWLDQCIRTSVRASRQRVAASEQLDTRLSRREREVLQHAALGVCNKELAHRLSISEATVKVHLTRIFQKLGVSSRAALAAAYHDAGAAARPGRTTPSAQNQPFG